MLAAYLIRTPADGTDSEMNYAALMHSAGNLRILCMLGFKHLSLKLPFKSMCSSARGSQLNNVFLSFITPLFVRPITVSFILRKSSLI
jgi:hypothetical protein